MSAPKENTIAILHQQEGSMSVAEFATANGLSFEQAARYCRAGKVMGARQDGRSKRWRVYPPAKLLVTPPKPKQLQAVQASPSAELPDLLAGVDAVAVEARTESRQSGQASPPVEAEGNRPSADQQAPEGRAAGAANVYRSPETQCACRGLVAAFKRQRAKGIHYLRMTTADCWQLYFAVREYRSRLKKAIGSGKVDHAELRATDSLWNLLKRDLATSTEGVLS